MSQRVLIVHYVLPGTLEESVVEAVCGEDVELSILEGQNRHVRHVYVTLSLSAVNCTECMGYVSLLILSNSHI